MAANVPTQLCINCMAAKPETAAMCPYCGYDAGGYKSHPIFLAPGTVLQAQYVLGRVLGQGGFGITYSGLDKHLCKRVAIKEYLPSALAARDTTSGIIVPLENQRDTFAKSLALFINEARYLAKFDHPNIVRVLNYFEANATGYMVMEYLEGVSPSQWLRERGGRVEPETALALVFPLLEALHQVHAENIYHLDISAQNIFIRPDNTPVLFDFGAARHVVGDYTHSLALVLKRGYSPLEQYSGEGRIGPWTDIYACAALLHLLLNGRLPPPAPERLHTETLQTLPTLTPALNKVLQQALALKHEERFQSVADFQQALEKAMQPVPKRSWQVWIAATGLVTLLAGGIYFQWPALQSVPAKPAVPPSSIVAGLSISPETIPLETIPPETTPPPPQQQQTEITRLTTALETRLAAGDATGAYNVYQSLQNLTTPIPQLATVPTRIVDIYLNRIHSTLADNRTLEAGRLLGEAVARFPQHAELRNLQIRLNDPAYLREQRLAKYFTQAETQLRALKLTTPAGDNAHETYRRILADTPGHPAALAGLRRIADEYAKLAKEENNPAKQKAFIAKGLSVFPRHPELSALQSRLSVPPPTPPSPPPPPALPDVQTLLVQAETARQQQNWENAVSLYKNVLMLQPGHAGARQGLQAIATVHLQQARRLLAEDRLSESLWQVAKGLVAVPGHSGLTTLQKNVEDRMDRNAQPPVADNRGDNSDKNTAPKEETRVRPIPITPSF